MKNGEKTRGSILGGKGEGVVTVVTMVTFTCLEKLFFLLCNVLINKSYNLRTLTIVYGQLIEWFR